MAAPLIAKFRGGLALLGPAVDAAANDCSVPTDSTTMPHHITLLTKEEYRSKLLGSSAADDALPSVSADRLYFLGLGGVLDKSVLWVVCVWSAGAAFRTALGLPARDFHITLTGRNVHSVAKDASSLVNPAELVASFREFSSEKQDHVLHYLHSIGSELTMPLAISCAIAHPDSAKDFVRLGDASARVNAKMAMLAYARALRLNASLQRYVARRFRRLRALTHYGPVMTATEREAMSCELRSVLLRDAWCEEARRIGHDMVPLEAPCETLVARSRDRLWYGDYELPRFFSWIVPAFLAGMSTPRNAEDVDKLAELGVNRVMTLTKEEPLPADWFAFKKVKNVFIPVANFEAPTFKEVDYFLEAVHEEDSVWVVHCGAGKGRAGTFLACYIALYGFQKPRPGPRLLPDPVCDAGTVIRWLRTLRPGSIETATQERFVASYVSHRWKSKTEPEELPEPAARPMRVEGRVPENPELVVLVGLPGSGKSWLSSAVAKRKAGVDVVSQDASGSRALCESAVSRRRPQGTMVVLDRCNPSRDERREWLALADVENSNAVAVYFDVDAAICTQRIDRRVHHPTLRAGRSANAMTHMKRQMTKPSVSEGFSAVITVPSFEAARQAVMTLAGTPPLVKFPRTQHLINLGAASPDDLVFLSNHQNDIFQQHPGTGPVVIEEKVDGANMGISLDYNGSLVVQNRSHTVTARSHAQFRNLDAWLDRHGPDLYALLRRDDQFPERHILYGEWVAATHSIPYSALPDTFLAFDFYDRVTNTFASREIVARLLQGTGIQQVPLVCTPAHGEVSRRELAELVTRASAFYEGPVEGVYVRFEDVDRLRTVARGKVVRADFIAGNEHWSKGILKPNGILGSPSSS